MIIDAHTHIYPDPLAARAIATVVRNVGDPTGQFRAHTDGTFKDLLRSMDEAGIDRSIVLPVATRPGQARSILGWIDGLRPRTDRLLFFGSVHPADPDWPELLRAIRDRGLLGIKLHPAYQGFPADSDEACRLYDEAFKSGLVVYLHAGFDRSMPKSDDSSIERFARVLERFDGAHMVLAHAGGEHEWEKVLRLLGGRRCWYDVAFVLAAMLDDPSGRELYRRNEDSFLFGSDSPWRGQKDYLQLVQGSAFLGEEQKEKLLSRNALRLLAGA